MSQIGGYHPTAFDLEKSSPVPCFLGEGAGGAITPWGFASVNTNVGGVSVISIFSVKTKPMPGTSPSSLTLSMGDPSSATLRLGEGLPPLGSVRQTGVGLT